MLATAVLAVSMALQGASEIPSKHLTPAPAPDKVLARVNGVDIKASDVQPLLWQWRGQEVTQDLINFQIIKTEATKKNLQVTEAEVTQAMEDQLTQLKSQLQPGQTVEQVMGEQGFDRARLYLRLKTEMLLNKIVAAEFKATDYVKVSTIIVRPANESAEALGEALKRANDYYDRLAKGESWDRLLAQVVDNPTVQQTKGMLGWRPIAAFPQVIQPALKEAKAGNVMKPVQTQNGIQIFRVEMLGPEAKDRDLEDLKSAGVQANRQIVLDRIRKEAKVERF